MITIRHIAKKFHSRRTAIQNLNEIRQGVSLL